MMLHTQGSMHYAASLSSALRSTQVTASSAVRDVVGGSVRSRLLPIAHARKKGKEQKNQGLYFDYEPVDAKAAEEVPIEKERLQEEFAWVQNARRSAQRYMGPDETRKKRRGAGGRRPPKSDDIGGQGTPVPPLQARPTLPVQPPPIATSSPPPSLLTPPGLRPRMPARPVHPLSAAPPPMAPSPSSPSSSPAGRGNPAAPSSSSQPQQPARAGAGNSTKAQRQEAAAKRAGTVAMSDEARRERISRLISSNSAAAVNVAAGAAPVAAGSGDKLSERKQRLLSRMQARPDAAAPPPTPASSTSSTPPHQSAPVQSVGLPAAGAAAGAAAAVAGLPATPAPSLSSYPGVEELELPALPELPPMPELPTEGLSEEELQAKDVLQALLSMDPRQMAGQRGSGSLSEVYTREKEAQEEFDAWVRELRANKAAAQQPSSNYGEGRHGGEAKPGATVGGGAGQIGAQEDEDEDNLQFLEGLDDLEASATRMLESQGEGLQGLGALLSRLQSAEDFGASEAELSKDDGPALSEEQVLAQLAATDPELHALLTSGPALDKEEEVEELTRALDSLARMGLGGPQDAEDGGAAAAMEGASEGVPGYEEEEVSDAELLEAARYDPDLAALLRGEKVGNLDLDRALDRELGEDFEGEEEEDDSEDLEALAGDMDGDVGFSDLFEALEEDPDISAEDKAQAMQELQGMFNSAGRLGKGGKAARRDPLEGMAGAKGVMTTTGPTRDGGDEGDAPVPLLPRPQPKRL